MSVQAAGFVGSWSFHPKPYSELKSCGSALQGIQPSEIRNLTALYHHYWIEALNGQPMGKSVADIKLNPLRPAPTIRRIGNFARWDEPRWLALNEYAILTSFPKTFEWVGIPRNAIERIGNSVPPKLMQAIADNIRNASFMHTDKQPTVIDLFSGCGGSSLGLKMAGFKELLAVEWDNNAAATFKLNFPNVPLFHGDICKLTSSEVITRTGLNFGELDLLTGSPPCQGFSTAGKRKFNDPRNSLFREYTRLLRDLQPKAFVMENVSGMVKGHMKQAYLTIVAELRSCGYLVKGQVLNAMYYGVPQSRERVIIVGVRKDLSQKYKVQPTHPNPQTKPISIAEALNIPVDSGKLIYKCNYNANNGQGEFHDVSFSRPCLTITRSANFSVKRYGDQIADLKKPLGTITKIGRWFLDEKNEFSLDAYKRLSSFPDDFKFIDFSTGKARIGNSVPPLLMKAIAAHIYSKILRICAACPTILREARIDS